MKYLISFLFILSTLSCQDVSNKQNNDNQLSSRYDTTNDNISETIIIDDFPVFSEKNEKIILSDGGVVYRNLDSMPKFHESNDKLLEYISNNLKYPSNKKKLKEGMCYDLL